MLKIQKKWTKTNKWIMVLLRVVVWVCVFCSSDWPVFGQQLSSWFTWHHMGL